jgi:ABC-2 type transport system permease protein
MINMALDDSIREMFAMIELEIRRLRHDRTEIYTRAVQPILWLGVFGTIMGRINAIPTGGLPYIDYITPGVLLQSTIFVSVFYGLTIVWERETGILKRLLVAPTSIYATVVGRSVASGVRAVVQALIIFPVAMLLGGELLPRPKGRGFPAASSLLRRHSPLASGRVSREFSVSVSLAQTYIRFAMQRFRSHRTGSGCSLPTLWNRLANPKSPRGRSDRSSK